MLGSAARLVLIGIAVGLPAAWLSSLWIASLLFCLTPTDPVTIVGRHPDDGRAARRLPARRAARVDPLVVLRHE